MAKKKDQPGKCYNRLKIVKSFNKERLQSRLPMKPQVYIETSIPSYLSARPSNDIRVVANRNTTLEWWENCRPFYEVFISEFVIAELSQGDPQAAAR